MVKVDPRGLSYLAESKTIRLRSGLAEEEGHVGINERRNDGENASGIAASVREW